MISITEGSYIQFNPEFDQKLSLKMSSSSVSTWEHVTQTVLGLSQDDIAFLHKKRIRSINFFRKSMDVQRLETTLGIKDGLYYELEDFLKYMIVNRPSNDELLEMTHEYYNDLSQDAIQTAYEVETATREPDAEDKSPHTHLNNANTQDYSHIIPSLIRTVDFIRYTNFSLSSTDGILKFYSDIQSQGSQYNILLKHIDEITPSENLFPDSLPPASVVLISGTLINKFRQEKVIMKDYKIGQNLLKATTDGFIFLKQLLMITHPKFSDTASGLNQIPSYSKFKDLYTYARAVKDYVEVQKIEGRHYNTKDISNFFLKYLDKPLYQKARMQIQNRVDACGDSSIPLSLQVPGLATTITQQMLELGEKIQEDTTYDTVTKLSSGTTDTISSLTDFDSVQSDFIHAVGNKKNAYNGVCKACGRPNHHDKDCNFLTKLRQCLAYMKMDKSAGPRKASFYRRKAHIGIVVIRSRFYRMIILSLLYSIRTFFLIFQKVEMRQMLCIAKKFKKNDINHLMP